MDAFTFPPPPQRGEPDANGPMKDHAIRRVQPPIPVLKLSRRFESWRSFVDHAARNSATTRHFAFSVEPHRTLRPLLRPSRQFSRRLLRRQSSLRPRSACVRAGECSSPSALHSGQRPVQRPAARQEFRLRPEDSPRHPCRAVCWRHCWWWAASSTSAIAL